MANIGHFNQCRVGHKSLRGAARLKVGVMITRRNQHRQMDEFCESVKIGFRGCAVRPIEDPVYFENY